MGKKFKAKKLFSTVAASALILGTVVTPAMASPGDYYQVSTQSQFTVAQLQADTNGTIKNYLTSAMKANPSDILIQFQNSLLQYSAANTLIGGYLTTGQSLSQISTELQAPNTATSTVNVSGYHLYNSISITAVAAVNATIPVGGTTGFTFTNSDGSVAATPVGVTYSVTSLNASTGFFNNGMFTATAAGTYMIQATVNGTNLTTTVNVSGQAVGITLSAGTSNNIVANGKNNTITATVVDANGVTVSNFNGTASLWLGSSPSASIVTNMVLQLSRRQVVRLLLNLLMVLHRSQYKRLHRGVVLLTTRCQSAV